MHAQNGVSERPPKRETPLTPLPEQLDSHAAKLLYLYLDAVGPATAEELSAALRIRKISLYPLLRHLASRDLVSRDGGTYRV